MGGKGGRRVQMQGWDEDWVTEMSLVISKGALAAIMLVRGGISRPFIPIPIPIPQQTENPNREAKRRKERK